MVWARTKLMIHDDLLRPRPVFNIHYTGPDPDKFYREIPQLIQTIYRLSEHEIQEKRFLWSKTEPERFRISWEINKDLDKFSYYWLEINLEGSKTKTHGEAKITVSSALRTEYPQDTYWQKSLLYEFLRMAWHTLFYSSTRDGYMREGRRLVSLFTDNLKSLARY